MYGVEEDDLLPARLHGARLHRDRQLDDRLDGAKAKLVVGLLTQHCCADLKHGTQLSEGWKVGCRMNKRIAI